MNVLKMITYVRIYTKCNSNENISTFLQLSEMTADIAEDNSGATMATDHIDQNEKVQHKVMMQSLKMFYLQ